MKFRSRFFGIVSVCLMLLQVAIALYYMAYAYDTGASYVGLCLWGCCLVPFIVPIQLLAWRNHAGARQERRHQELLHRARIP